MRRRTITTLPLPADGELLVEHWGPAAGPSPGEDRVGDGPAGERVALLSDLHVAGNSQIEISGINPSGHLEGVLQQWLLRPHARPDYVMIAGDCAMIAGWVEDYRQLASLLAMLDEMGLPWRSVLGNHDCRENFARVFADRASARPRLPGRQVGVIDTPAATWLLLDTLDQTNEVPGLLGEAQCRWLRDTLAALPDPDKPILVLGHHNLQFDAGQDGWFGLRDSTALVEALDADARVKAYIHGHSHQWRVGQRESGLWLVNLPALSFAFSQDQPIGWVEARLAADAIHLRLHPLRDNGAAGIVSPGPAVAATPPVLTLHWR